MINLQLLDIVKESLPNFDGENSSDLIKAEKILKAHQKTNPELLLNDIENFIEFFRENGNNFNVLFEDENLSKICKGEYFRINSSHNRVFPNIMQITPEFRTFCEEHIKSYIQVNIQNNDWENLRIFYKNYFPVISPLAREFLINQISQKNKLVRSIIPEPNHYNYLLTQYKHGINPYFYALQSDIDSSYFNNEILDINNDVSEHQNIDTFFKVFLGKILVALGHFDAYTEDLRRILKKNSRIGADWASKEYTFDSRGMAQIFLQKSQQMQQTSINKKYFEDKDSSSDWMATIFYYIIPIAFFGFLIGVNRYVFTAVFIIEAIVFLIANKKMEKRYKRLYIENNNPSSEKIKKFGYKLMRVQLYTFMSVVFIAVFAGVIVAWTTNPVIGLLLTIGLSFVIRRELKKYK